MRRPASPLATATLAMLLAGGGCGGGVSGARYSFILDGSGVTNSKPLEPLRVGSVLRRDDDPATPLVVEDEIDIDGTAIRRVLRAGAVTWYAFGSDGLFLEGPSEDPGGKLAHPLLLVPRIVRAGQQWDVWDDDSETARYHFTVTARDDALTVEGRQVRWHIEERDRKTGTTTMRRYLEGRGLAEESVGGVVVRQRREVFPLEEPSLRRDSRGPLLPLLPLPVGADAGPPGDPDTPVAGAGGEATLGGTRVVDLSMVRPRGSLLAALPLGRADGGLACLATDGTRLVRGTIEHQGGGGEGAPFQITDGACPAVRACRGGTCRDLLPSSGSQALVGDRVWWSHAPGGSFDGSTLALLSAPPASALPQLLTLRGGASAGAVDGALWIGPGTAFPGFTDADADVALDSPLAALRRAVKFTLNVPHDARTASLLLADDEGRMSSTQLVDGRLTAPAAATTFGGVVVGQASERGVDLLYVTGDGGIDAIDISGDSPLHAHLADLALPPSHRLRAAFRLAGNATTTLVAITATPGADGGELLHFYRVGGFAPMAAARDRSRSFAATLRPAGGPLDAGGDLEVCFPRGGMPALDGWTLGGVAARAVIPLTSDGNCLLLLRDGGTSPPLPGGGTPAIDRHLVTGALPGAIPLPVALTLPTDAPAPRLFDGDAAGGWLAPLATGGFVSPGRRYRPDGLPASTSADAPRQAGGWFIADAAGSGLWLEEPALAGGGNRVRLVGGRGIEYQHLDGNTNVPAPLHPRFAAGGGGVVAETADGGVTTWLLLPPDGKPGLPLPLPPGETVTPMGRAASGTTCGTRRTSGAGELFCLDPDTTLRAVPLGSLAGPLPDRLWPLPDGSFVGVGGDGTVRLDPRAEPLSLPLLDARAIDKVTWGPDGTLWAIADKAVVRVSAEGLVAVPLPTNLVAASARPAFVAVEQRLLVVLFDDGSALRLPRP